MIIPIYNGEQYVAKAINSVLAQTYQNIEILLINDGSSDGSKAVILDYINLPNVVYREQSNGGVAAARNIGLRAARGELIAFLDQDDVWMPQKIELQAQYMQTHPKIGLVHANIEYIDEHSQPIEKRRSEWQTNASGLCFEEMFKENGIAVLTVCIRRKVCIEIGYFREDVSGVDDYDYWLRVAYSHQIGHINQVLAHYRLHTHNESQNWLRQEIRLSRVLEDAISDNPVVRRDPGANTVKSRLLPIYRKIYSEYYRRNEHLSARPYLLKCMRLDPWQKEYYLKLMVGTLPARLRIAFRWYLKKYF